MFKTKAQLLELIARLPEDAQIDVSPFGRVCVLWPQPQTGFMDWQPRIFESFDLFLRYLEGLTPSKPQS